MVELGPSAHARANNTDIGTNMHTVRKVLPHEYRKYRTHLKALDADSKYLRFGSLVTDEVIDNLCNSIEEDQDHHILFCVEGDDLEFLAIGHIALATEMELAFSVLKPHQGHGIGNALMRRCIQWCRTHGILHGTMICLSTNEAIRHLCKKNGMKMRRDHGEILSEFDFDYAGIDTFIAEATDQNLAVLDWVTKRANKLFKTTIHLV